MTAYLLVVNKYGLSLWSEDKNSLEHQMSEEKIFVKFFTLRVFEMKENNTDLKSIYFYAAMKVDHK